MLGLTINNFKFSARSKTICYDVLLIIIMATLAACGMVYQYLLSNYAGRVIGMMEHAIFTMIGIMIVSMGFGSFAAKPIKCAFSGFAWLEAIIALLGASGILIISWIFALSALVPELIALNYNLPEGYAPAKDFIQLLQNFAAISPFIIGFIIGFLIGMEIPFIARVREKIYNQHLEHNIGTIYGADYIGAGIGAAIFVTYMLSLPIEMAAIYTAIVNLIAGMFFLILFYSQIRYRWLLIGFHLIITALVVILFYNAENWQNNLQNMLYEDNVVYNKNSNHQNITITKRIVSPEKPPIYALYLNGHTQFSSDDEYIYHELLVHPAMVAAARHDNILVIGGGDGLAIREILRWNPKNITLLELDRDMVELFSANPNIDSKESQNNHISNDDKKPPALKAALLELNNYSLSDDRINIIYGDAYGSLSELSKKINAEEKFDVVIIDLPDPSHPNLNKLYSKSFYRKLYHIVNEDAVISVQSTSPFHAKKTFLTIGITLQASGFNNIARYHHNVPSFGQWGWTLASKNGKSIIDRIHQSDFSLPQNLWLNKELMLAVFEFGNNFFDIEDDLQPNLISNNLLYILHQQEWQQN